MLACRCGLWRSERQQLRWASGTAPAAASCPAAWAAGWQAWTDRIGAIVYCPTFSHPRSRAEIDGQWNTARSPGRQWQLGYAWLEHDPARPRRLRGYPAADWPPKCPGQPCFAHELDTTVGGFNVHLVRPQLGSHWHHVAAAFPANGYVYMVSMHVITPYDTEQKARVALRKTIAGLVAAAVLRRLPRPWPIRSIDVFWHDDMLLHDTGAACSSTPRRR